MYSSGHTIAGLSREDHMLRGRSLIGFQSFINIGVASKLLPNTGVPLPFVSYGLTSLVSLYVGIGFVLNVGLQPKNINKGVENNEYWLR